MQPKHRSDWAPDLTGLFLRPSTGRSSHAPVVGVLAIEAGSNTRGTAAFIDTSPRLSIEVAQSRVSMNTARLTSTGLVEVQRWTWRIR